MKKIITEEDKFFFFTILAYAVLVAILLSIFR